jgi:molecular chaperone HscB
MVGRRCDSTIFLLRPPESNEKPNRRLLSMTKAAAYTENGSQSLCLRCGTQTGGAHSCSDCGTIKPVTSTTDYFSFFGLLRKLQVDEPELEKTFYWLSRQFHPDYFMNAGELERQASIERSSMLNDAYRTLRDPIARVTYLLALEGYNEAQKKAPPDLLEEVFELNMQIEELRGAKKARDEDEIAEARGLLEHALASLRENLAGIDRRVFALFADWDSALDRNALETHRKLLLDQMSQLLSHRSYIRNLVRDIKEEL